MKLSKSWAMSKAIEITCSNLEGASDFNKSEEVIIFLQRIFSALSAMEAICENE